MPFGTPPTHPTLGLLQCPRCPDTDVYNAGYSLAVAYHSILDSLLLFRQLNIWVDLFIRSFWNLTIFKTVIRSSELICCASRLGLYPSEAQQESSDQSSNSATCCLSDGHTSTWPGHKTLLALISLSLSSSSHQWRLYVSACRCGRETRCQFWSTVFYF